MKKLSKEEFEQITNQILDEQFSNTENETTKYMAQTILGMIEVFMLKYQEKADE